MTSLRLAAAGAAAFGVLSLAACSAEPAPEPELLTVSDAGARYLGAVCPVNDAWGDVNVEVDRLRIVLARGGADAEAVDTALFVESIRAVEAASVLAEEQLGDATIEWPSVAARAITAVRSTLERDIQHAPETESLAAQEAASYVWPGAEQSAQAAREARESLGLPDDPVVACDMWATEQADRLAEEQPEDQPEQ